MSEPLKDNRGVEIRAGYTVVFNISGQVAMGKVISAEWGKPRKYYTPAKIKVEMMHKAAGHHKGHISTVTNPQNALVI